MKKQTKLFKNLFFKNNTSILNFMTMLVLLIGLLIGGIAAWFIAKYKYTSQTNSIPFDEVKERYAKRCTRKPRTTVGFVQR